MPLFDLTGRTAFVTGASGGIGGAIARALVGQGASVALGGTKITQLEALAAELMRLGVWTPYVQGQRPDFIDEQPARIAAAQREQAAYAG